MRLRFERDDGGRAAAGFKGTTGDCVVRAVAIASGKPYGEVYKALARGMGEQRQTRGIRSRATARRGVSVRRKWFKDYMRALGFEWTATMHIGSGCKVHLHDGELPAGHLVVSVSKHYVAVVDGVIRDLSDPRRDGVRTERFPGWETAPLKPGQTRNVNGVHTVERRCVYGYWRKA